MRAESTSPSSPVVVSLSTRAPSALPLARRIASAFAHHMQLKYHFDLDSAVWVDSANIRATVRFFCRTRTCPVPLDGAPVQIRAAIFQSDRRGDTMAAHSNEPEPLDDVAMRVSFRLPMQSAWHSAKTTRLTDEMITLSLLQQRTLRDRWQRKAEAAHA